MRAWDAIAVVLVVITLVAVAAIALVDVAESKTGKVVEPKGERTYETPAEIYEKGPMKELNQPPSENGPHCADYADWYAINGGKQINCYEGTCKEGECTSVEKGEQTCQHCRTTEAFWTRSDAICLQNPESNVLVLICGRDNVEKRCCCYVGKHTYFFDTDKHIGNVEVRYETGFGYGCRSDVNVLVIDKQGEEKYVTSLKGIGHKMLMASLDLSKYGRIKGIVLDEGGNCYLDMSALILEVLPE